MAKAQGEQIWVWLDDSSFGPLQRIGSLSRGDRGSVRFAYDPNWLKKAHAFPLADEALSAPPIARIAELQAVAFELTRKKQDDFDKMKEWLRVLVAPGVYTGRVCKDAN